MPIALPDLSQSQPVFQARPLGPGGHHPGEIGKALENGERLHKPVPLLLPDRLNLLPLDPP